MADNTEFVLREDESKFELRTQDVTAPRHVMLWLAENINHISEAKARKAFEVAIAMTKWPERKIPD